MNDRPESRPPRGTPRLRTIVAEPCSPRSIALRTELNSPGLVVIHLELSNVWKDGTTEQLTHGGQKWMHQGIARRVEEECRNLAPTRIAQRNLMGKGRGRWKNRNEEIVCVLCVHARVGQRNARTIRRNVLRFALFLPPRSELTTRNSIY